MKALLMGGQACIYYGGATFSIDSDFAVLAEEENLARLQKALDELQAKNIATPPFDADLLRRGQAVHFRCFAPGCENLRVDIMAKMRGVDEFSLLWERRTTARVEHTEESFELLALPDLVKAKKTQRSKDWPMIEALLEAHYMEFQGKANAARLDFWTNELRTPRLLRELCAVFPHQSTTREAAILAQQCASETEILAALKREEEREREADRLYWAPLKRELEAIRRARHR